MQIVLIVIAIIVVVFLIAEIVAIVIFLQRQRHGELAEKTSSTSPIIKWSAADSTPDAQHDACGDCTILTNLFTSVLYFIYLL